LLNFTNRRHDIWNVMATGCIVSMVGRAILLWS
jgi:hypothetical protein